MSSTGSNVSYTGYGHMNRMNMNICNKYGGGNAINLSDRPMNNTVDTSYIGSARNIINDSSREGIQMTRSVMDGSYRYCGQMNRNGTNPSQNDGPVFNESKMHTSYRDGQEMN